MPINMVWRGECEIESSSRAGSESDQNLVSDLISLYLHNIQAHLKGLMEKKEETPMVDKATRFKRKKDCLNPSETTEKYIKISVASPEGSGLVVSPSPGCI